MAFNERLNFILAGRKPSPWGATIGFNSALTTRMSSGIAPGAEILSCITLTENANASWLLTSNGSPFITQNFQSDLSLCHALSEYCSLNAYSIYLLFDRESTIILLSNNSAELDFKGKPVKYRAIKVLTGPVGEHSLYALSQILNRGNTLYGCYIDPNSFKQIYEGQVGTYKVFGNKDVPGIASSPIDLLSPESIKEFVLTKDDKCNDINYEIMSRIVLLVEKAATEDNIKVSQEAKSRIISLAYRRAIFSNITADMIDDYMVQSLFDMNKEF